ncbi:MAG TPA: helix-hairpin-helix domain-containing protein [Pedobacter sp.]|jgi:DNA uptake protein ComE-like DNA-binding protein
MRKWLNNYFDFTKSEFNGLVVLIVLIALVTAAPYAYALVGKDEYNAKDDLILKRLILKDVEDAGDEKLAYKSFKSSNGKVSTTATRVNRKVSLFYFDPNLIELADWMRLGLSEKQAAAILRYVEKGGQFRQATDLKKMYTISPDKYLEIFPYVKIGESAESNQQSTTKANGLPFAQASTSTTSQFKSKTAESYVKKEAVVVEINGADSASLDDIRGIGPAFALRILSYRERIGGYVNKEQLMEVFGLDSLKYSEIKGQVRVDASSIRKINVNTVTADNLKNHPYLRFKQLNAIVQYRKQHGNYNSIGELAKVVVLPAETIARLAPYLIF